MMNILFNNNNGGDYNGHHDGPHRVVGGGGGRRSSSSSDQSTSASNDNNTNNNNNSANNRSAVARNNDPQLYFKIVCDPGHERTARELRNLPKERRERVWADMTGDPTTTHYSQQQEDYYKNNEQDPTLVNEKLKQLSQLLYETIQKQQQEDLVHHQQQSNEQSTTSSSHRKSSKSSSCHALCQAYNQDPDLFLHRYYSINDGTNTGGLPAAIGQAPPAMSPTATSATATPDDVTIKRAMEFHLMFLRCCRFHIQPTCDLMIKYFRTKSYLFGIDKLTKCITLEDLSHEDKISLQSGGIQILPQRDHAGRLVVFSRYRNWIYPNQNKMHLLRAVWYMFHASIQDDVITQQLGVIIVGYELADNTGSSDSYVPIDHELTRQMFRVLQAMPVRVVAAHTCYNDSPTQKVVDLVIHMVSNFVRLRLRCHFGSHQECKYRLMTMGIPVQVLPILEGSGTNGGDCCQLKLNAHLAWYHYRLRQEAAIVESDDEQQYDYNTTNKDVGGGGGVARNVVQNNTTNDDIMIIDDDDDEDDYNNDGGGVHLDEASTTSRYDDGDDDMNVGGDFVGIDNNMMMM